jgi:NDP-sugar pyrophosphorylase family protein
MRTTVLITTSGIGERLGEYTKYTNKSLIKVGDKYAICYIIENYDKDTHFIVTLGHYGNYVKDFLTMAYPDRTIEYVYVDKYQGEGSSLGYSLLQAKPLLQHPFIFHCCDAITFDGKPSPAIPRTPTQVVIDVLAIHLRNSCVVSPGIAHSPTQVVPPCSGNTTITTASFEIVPNKNILYVSFHSSNAQYSSILTENNKVKSLNDKNCESYEYVYTGISYIHDFSEFWKSLQNVYDANPMNSSLSDIHAIKQMIVNGVEFEYKVLSKWYDTGNQSSYNQLKQLFIPKYEVIEKNNESLCFMENSVIKFINDATINEKRVLRGDMLYPLTPKIQNVRSHFIQMDLIDGTILSGVYRNEIIYELLHWTKKNVWINSITNDKYINCCKQFYISKTISRINNLSFLTNEYSCINGFICPNIKTLIEHIPLELICTDTFTQFHGDFILDNIIFTDNMTFKLIDWRHEFDTELTHGDIYYDLAKLRHNLIINHKNINNKLFDIKYNKENVTVDVKCNFLHYRTILVGANFSQKILKL